SMADKPKSPIEQAAEQFEKQNFVGAEVLLRNFLKQGKGVQAGSVMHALRMLNAAMLANGRSYQDRKTQYQHYEQFAVQYLRQGPLYLGLMLSDSLRMQGFVEAEKGNLGEALTLHSRALEALPDAYMDDVASKFHKSSLSYMKCLEGIVLMERWSALHHVDDLIQGIESLRES